MSQESAKPPEPFDPDDVLGGWRASAAPRREVVPGELDDLVDVVARRARNDYAEDAARIAPDLPEEEWQPSGAAPLDASTRLAASTQPQELEIGRVVGATVDEVIDVADLDDIGLAASAAARTEAVEWVERIADPQLAEVPTFIAAPHPRQALAWQPGVWVAAARRVADAGTAFVQTPQGPVIEAQPPLYLLALWMPQRLEEPLLPRWPHAAALVACEPPGLVEAGVTLLPEGTATDVLLWCLSDIDAVDWALVADIVRHHDSRLSPTQLELVEALIEAERDLSFERVNEGFAAAADGVPRQRR